MTTTATTAFAGFPREGFAFLADLATDNTREFFDAHRATYESALLEPAKGFVTALGEQLQARVSPGIRAEPRVNGSILRITRDTERCPVVVCYRYHLVTERRKLPRHALVDLASLHLAPDLRSRVDRAHIDLLIEAVEHRKTINGRETQVFVATNLAGVTPHDSPF